MLAYANALGYLYMYMHNCVEIETNVIQKDKILDSPSALISFSYIRNKNKNSSIEKIGLTRVTDSRTAAQKS